MKVDVIRLGPLSPRRRRRMPERVARFVDAVRWLCSAQRHASFTRWYDLPCERCGPTRDYRVWGHFQVVCFTCASPTRRIRVDSLIRDAAERRN